MCGIVGYVGKKKVVPVILEGLRRLEYRGYDSAGIAVGSPARSTLELRRAPGGGTVVSCIVPLRCRDTTGSYERS